MVMVYVGGASQNENPPGKGDKLTIETGKNEVTYAHTVDSPKEVLTGQDANGIMLAGIADAAGTQLLIKLAS